MRERNLQPRPREKASQFGLAARSLVVVVLAYAAQACEKTSHSPPEEKTSQPTVDFIVGKGEDEKSIKSLDKKQINDEEEIERIYQLSIPTKKPPPAVFFKPPIEVPTSEPPTSIQDFQETQIPPMSPTPDSNFGIDGEKISQAQKLAQKILEITREHQDELPDLVGTKPTNEGLEQLPIYFPIYLAGQEKYNVPWFQLWIMHGAESNFSLDEDSFAGLYRGPMQRHQSFFPDEEVYQVSIGFEYLASLATNQPNLEPAEWQEILWGAFRIDFLWNEMGSLKGASYRYCDPTICADPELASYLAWRDFFTKYLPKTAADEGIDRRVE